jgi:hypothetical protein
MMVPLDSIRDVLLYARSVAIDENWSLEDLISIGSLGDDESSRSLIAANNSIIEKVTKIINDGEIDSNAGKN